MIQDCRYGCGKKIRFVGKDFEVKHDTGMREEDGTPHTYDRCRELIRKERERVEAIKKVNQEHGGGLEAFSS